MKETDKCRQCRGCVCKQSHGNLTGYQLVRGKPLLAVAEGFSQSNRVFGSRKSPISGIDHENVSYRINHASSRITMEILDLFGKYISGDAFLFHLNERYKPVLCTRTECLFLKWNASPFQFRKLWKHWYRAPIPILPRLESFVNIL